MCRNHLQIIKGWGFQWFFHVRNDFLWNKWNENLQRHSFIFWWINHQLLQLTLMFFARWRLSTPWRKCQWSTIAWVLQASSCHHKDWTPKNRFNSKIMVAELVEVCIFWGFVPTGELGSFIVQSFVQFLAGETSNLLMCQRLAMIDHESRNILGRHSWCILDLEVLFTTLVNHLPWFFSVDDLLFSEWAIHYFGESIGNAWE